MRPDSDFENYTIMNADGTKACTYEGGAFVKGMKLTGQKAYFWDSDSLTILDPKTGSKDLIIPEEHGFSDFLVEYTLNKNSDKCVFWTPQSLMISDLVEKKSIFEYRSEESIGTLLLSDDGKRVTRITKSLWKKRQSSFPALCSAPKRIQHLCGIRAYRDNLCLALFGLFGDLEHQALCYALAFIFGRNTGMNYRPRSR